MKTDAIPQQPYFLRALYEWCVDSGYTPYVSVAVDKGTRVPNAYVKEGQLVLNIGPAAVRNLHMDNDWLSFSARFGGVSQVIEVPVNNVLAIYARETGEGMSFQTSTPSAASPAALVPLEQEDNSPPNNPDKPKGRPSLRVVK